MIYTATERFQIVEYLMDFGGLEVSHATADPRPLRYEREGSLAFKRRLRSPFCSLLSSCQLGSVWSFELPDIRFLLGFRTRRASLVCGAVVGRKFALESLFEL
jgi:hypothetical protein